MNTWIQMVGIASALLSAVLGWQGYRTWAMLFAVGAAFCGAGVLVRELLYGIDA